MKTLSIMDDSVAKAAVIPLHKIAAVQLDKDEILIYVDGVDQPFVCKHDTDIGTQYTEIKRIIEDA